MQRYSVKFLAVKQKTLNNIKPFFAVAAVGLLLVGCAQKQVVEPAEPPPSPTPKRVKVAIDNPDALPGQTPQTTVRNLFNVAINTKGIYVNRVKVANIAALEQLLSSTPALMLTLNAHRCLDSAKASEVLSMMQKYTRSPIAFGSFGEYTDAECAEQP